MHTTAAPVFWPRPSATAVRASDGAASHQAATEWLIRRNCSIAPGSMLCVFGALCVVSLSIAAAFASMGATPVLAFAGLEVLVLGVALLVHARHAIDHEVVRLHDGRLAVEQHCGGRVSRSEFNAAWARVEPPAPDRALIRIGAEGRSTLVGTHLRADLRAALAQEIQTALRAQCLPAASEFNTHTATKRTR